MLPDDVVTMSDIAELTARLLAAPAAAADFAGASGDDLLTHMTCIEQLVAALTARSVAALEAMVTAREQEYLEQLPPDATARQRNLDIQEIDAAVIDEVELACGLSTSAARFRLHLAQGDIPRTAPVRRGMARGELSPERARRIHERTAEVAAEHVEGVVDALIGPYPALSADGVGGLAVPHHIFTSRLSRAVARHVDTRTRHEARLHDRHARLDIGADGLGTLLVEGHVLRAGCALGRVDGIARRLRSDGDPRTLAQLRSDIALDLLLWGQLPTEPGAVDLPAYAAFQGALPPACLDVTVSAASLMGATEEPGLVEIGGRHEWVAAHIVRDVAFAAGSVWRRLVTDPVTGHMVDLSTTAYAVTGKLRDRIIARDRVSRVPGSARPASRCDMDHDVNHADGGPTSESNVSAKHRRGHNHKTRGTWVSRRDPGVDGRITWTTPTGRQYVTTPWDYRDPEPASPESMLDNLAAHRAEAPTPPPPVQPKFAVDRRIEVCPECRRERQVDTFTCDIEDRPIFIRDLPLPGGGTWHSPDPGPPPF